MQLPQNSPFTFKLQAFLFSCCLLTSQTFAMQAQGVWTAMQGNPAHTGYLAQTTRPANYHVVWSKIIFKKEKDDHYFGLGLTGQPVITDENVYFTTSHRSDTQAYQQQLLAFNIKTGATVFTEKFKNFQSISMPTFSEGNLIVLLDKEDYENSQLNVYQPETGKLKYTLSLSGTYWHDPMAYDGNLYVNVQKALTSFDLASGLINLTVNHNESIVTPALGNNTLLLISDEDRGHGLDIINRRTGELIKNIAVPTDLYHNPARRYPVLDETNNAAYFVYRSNILPHSFLYAFDLQKQNVKWVVPSIFSQVIVADVYAVKWDEVNKKLQLIDINAATGEVKWTWQPEGTEVLALGDAYSYDLVATSDMIFVPGKTKTYAISRATHQKVWEIEKTGMLSLGKGVLLINSTENETTESVAAVAIN